MDIDNALDDLIEKAPNEQVELLIEVLEEEHIHRKILEDTVEDHARRIRRLEAQEGLRPQGQVVDDPHFDHRDQPVLSALDSAEKDVFAVSELQKLYKKHTEIRQKETLKDRIKTLTEYGPLEREAGTAGNRYRYIESNWQGGRAED